jgi:hypothetical protein
MPEGFDRRNRQIRSLVLCVGLVGPRRIWAAQVGCLVGPDGSRRIQKDRLRVLGHPDHGDRWWSGHQIFHLVTHGGLGARTAAAPSNEQRITRQQRIVHGVLASALLAAQVKWVVQPVRSSRAE